MLKTIKGKVIAGTVSVALLSSAGVAFANSDAGVNLKNWYDGQFGLAKSDIRSDVESHVTGEINGWANEYVSLRTAAGTSIDNDRIAANDLASDNIDTRTQEHITSINTTQADIESYMNRQFRTLFSDANVVINQAGDLALSYANDDLTDFTGTEGDDARDELTEALGTKKNEAVLELQQAIEDAQTELQTQLDNKEALTTQAIINAIDAKINSLRTAITQKRDDLVAAQKLLIDAKALELENAAKDALQSVVDDI